MGYLRGLLVRVVLCFVPFSVFYKIFLPLTVYGVGLFLLPLGPGLAGDAVFLGGYEFVFVEACVASAAYWLFWALAMLVKDVSVKVRAKLVFTCFGFFLAANVLRVVALVVVALRFGERWFDLVHLAMWKLVSGVLVAVIWIVVVRLYRVDSVPVWDDVKYLYGRSVFIRRGSGRRAGRRS